MLAAHGFEDSAKLVQRVSPKGTVRGNFITVAFVLCLSAAGNWGWVAIVAVAAVWVVGFGAERLLRKPKPVPPPMVVVLGRFGRYVDDGIGPMVRLSEHARIDFGSLWYAPGFALTVTDGDRRWAGEVDIGRRGLRLIRAAWAGGEAASRGTQRASARFGCS